MADLTPREIVAELDKFIVGQDRAKRAVAVAIRNRLRRQKVQGDLQDDIIPKNILMRLPPESARRRYAGGSPNCSPVRQGGASKFTEVGYVGRDVIPSCATWLSRPCGWSVTNSSRQRPSLRRFSLADRMPDPQEGTFPNPSRCCSIPESAKNQTMKTTLEWRRPGGEKAFRGVSPEVNAKTKKLRREDSTPTLNSSTAQCRSGTEHGTFWEHPAEAEEDTPPL